MPNWKKVITSGSNAHLNEITASAFQFVGSGTAELEVQGHITASGDISSSGTMTSNVIVNAEGGTINDSGGASSFRVKGQNDDNLIFTNASGNDNVGIGQAPVAGDSKLQVTGDLNITSHITSSGNISASGDITSNTLNVNTSGELTGSYGTLHGAFNINYGNATTFSSSLASAGDGYGEIMSHLPINGPSAGDLVYLTGADWRPADADGTSKGSKMLGVALADGGGASVPGPVLIRGVVRLGAGHIVDSSGANGDPLYLSTTDAHVQFAVPSSNPDVARIVGYCIDETNDIIYFNPSNTFVEIA